MPVITQIKQQKSKNRVNIYLDGKFGFGIDLENFIKLGLRVEQELTQKQIDEITDKSQLQKSLEKALNFAMVRPRSEREIVGWFIRKKVANEYHDRIFEKLKKYDLIDDEKFARWWVDQRQNFRPKSKKVLSQELRIKGIKKEIVEKVLGEIKIDEGTLASELIGKNLYKWEKFDKFVARKKKTEYLARKGFSWDVIKTAIGNQIDDNDC